jgi:O-antigen ligase
MAKPATVKARGKPGLFVVESVGIIWVCTLAGMLALFYARIPAIELWLILVVTAGVAFVPLATMRMAVLDWTVLALCAYEALALVFSQYRANSIRASWTIALSALIFVVVRLTMRTHKQMAWLGGLLGIGGAWLAITGLNQFATNVGTLREAGLSDLVAFRSRLILPPPPWILGEWLTLLLLVLPFACALPMYLWRRGRNRLAVLTLIPPILISAVLVVSCSRAVFWSLILFVLVGCVLMSVLRVIRLRTGAVLLGSALAALILILACEDAIYPGILTAYTGRHTSQIRSTEGRIGIWQRSWDVARAHPLLGVGSSNAALALMSSADQDETTGFASRTFSLPVQVLVEKGSVGFLLYSAFLLLAGWEFVRNMHRVPKQAPPPARRASKKNSPQLADKTGAFWDDTPCKAMLCCFAAGFAAVLVREFAYSSVLEHTLSAVLLLMLAALATTPQMDDGL